MLQDSVYYKDGDIDNIIFPVAQKRPIYHGLRTQKPIPGYREIVDRSNDNVFAIVKEGYNLVLHEDVIRQMDSLCAEFPEYGVPTREIWMSNFGGRMKTRWTFTDIDFAIGTLSDGTPDTVHPTMETFCSYDTSLAQHTLIGGFRVICSNGMIVGKVLGRYKKKHTTSLDLTEARRTLANGMRDYSKAQNLWLEYYNRNASSAEVNCFDALGFKKDEKEAIEVEIKKQGKVLEWDDEDKDKRRVDINAWALFNILTDQASHHVKDVTRQAKVQANIANAFS